MARQLSSDKNVATDAITGLLDKSAFHLEEGAEHFASLADAVNQALLLSNLGRLNRVRAFCLSCRDDCDAKGDANSSEFSEDEVRLYSDAISCYQRALGVLGQRKKKHSGIYDTVCWELSTTHFTLASQLQDFAPLSRKSKPDVVRQIADHYSKSLEYCESEMENESRLPILQYRSASIHARLAALYHHCHRAGTPEGGSKFGQSHYRTLAESHYERAAALYSAVEDHGELLRCLLEQISLQEFLMEESHPTKKTFQTILSLFVQALPTLKALRTKVQVRFFALCCFVTDVSSSFNFLQGCQ